jgi:hypothetical protein
MPTDGLVISKVAALPDVDTDIDDSRRSEVIDWTKERFGEDHVAQIGTWGKYAAKNSVVGCLKASNRFQDTYPNDFHNQALKISALISKKPMYRIANTAFSSVTLNRNFRTALHCDAGDYREGFGNLSVIERGEYTGGYTLFPRYGIGFDVRTGDFLAMDVHEWHCNTEMKETSAQATRNKALPDIYKDDPTTGTVGMNKPYTRISFVCYFREKLTHCIESQTRKYHKKIKFDPENGKASKFSGKTRKHTH